VFSGDVFIPNLIYRNRAIHGDVVAVVLLPQSQWSAPSSSLKDSDDEDDEGLIWIRILFRIGIEKTITK
jgi:exoribonuclease R